MSTINPYQVSIANTAVNVGTYVIISNTKTKIDYKNAVKTRNKSTSFSNRGSTTIATQTKVTNRLKITKTFTITGHLANGQFEYASGKTENYTTAKNKRNALETILESGDTLYLMYDGTRYQGAIQTMSITEIGTQIDGGNVITGVIGYDISITFVVGVDKLNKLIN